MNPTKQQLRKKLIEQRTILPASHTRAASQLIAKHVLDYLGDIGGVTVGCYMAFRGEVDTIPLAESIIEKLGIVAMPHVDGNSNQLIFKVWSPGDKTVRSRLGIEEPELSAKTVIPSVLLLPLVGFDEKGFRLGYGGGYYDRALARLRTMPITIRVIGLGYAMQQVASLPYEVHDARLDAVATEQGVIEFSRNA